uniref:Uncharacterized protein n=1 Tax=Timspurckia oligopyrenoides TaxID=708627 RepID=A0A7S0ZLJ4_9RHOD|mmetsp:Transcript_9945/g.17911  ORF Transcript_9945/g.17911 Transcript_9945/m.17911 type:complete len:427 (+) Transcript_9945:36-1316(+)
MGVLKIRVELEVDGEDAERVAGLIDALAKLSSALNRSANENSVPEIRVVHLSSNQKSSPDDSTLQSDPVSSAVNTQAAANSELQPKDPAESQVESKKVEQIPTVLETTSAPESSPEPLHLPEPEVIYRPEDLRDNTQYNLPPPQQQHHQSHPKPEENVAVPSQVVPPSSSVIASTPLPPRKATEDYTGVTGVRETQNSTHEYAVNAAPAVALPVQELPLDVKIVGILQEAALDSRSVDGAVAEILHSVDAARFLSPESDAIVGKQLEDAFLDALFDPALLNERLAKQCGVMAVVEILCMLDQASQVTIKEHALKTILSQLNIPRSANGNRLEFFAYAEAFAAFCWFGIVPIRAAMKSIISLLVDPRKRSAAITTLGKTVELCLEMIVSQVDPPQLAELKQVLQRIHEPEYQYDLEYIQENLSWLPK